MLGCGAENRPFHRAQRRNRRLWTRSWTPSRQVSPQRSCWPASPGSARRASSQSWAPARTPAASSCSRGSASELENDLPFSAFVDALDEYLRGLDPERLASLDDDVRTELAQVFPSLTALGTPQDVALQHERYRSHRAVRALLEQLASAQPLVLALDDLHWADSASVELFGALLRRPPPPACCSPRRSVRTRCPSGSPPRSRARSADSMLARVELGPLTVEEARALVGDAAARALRGERRQPLLSRAARARATGPAAGEDEASLGGIRGPRLGRRGPDRGADAALAPARLALEGAAVAGDPFEPELAAAAAELPETSVMDALDELLRRRPRPPNRRTEALSLPSPARAARGLRGDRRRLAPGSSRAVRRRTGCARRTGRCAGAPRRALCARGRARGGRGSARGRRRGGPARAGKRRPLVRERAAPAPAGRNGRGAASSSSSPAPAR